VNQQQGISPSIVVVGAGLAGSLLALALARRGTSVALVGSAHPSATVLSYGSLPGSALRSWRRLERWHGPLGLHPSRLVLHGWPGPLRLLPAWMQALATAPLPFARVDAPTLAAALSGALERAGVIRWQGTVSRIEPRPGGGWWAIGGDGVPIGQGSESGDSSRLRGKPQLVLAAGAANRNLCPDLPERLRYSWAGVIEVDPSALDHQQRQQPWLQPVLRGRIVQPLRLRRPPLEAGAGALTGERWIVDAGLAPSGNRILLGQITLVGADPDPTRPPDPATMEARLRAGLEELDPQLASLPGTYRQVPVSFCLGGSPLAGPVENASGLWVFSGFSGAFAVVPLLAEALADQLVGEGELHRSI
jgi:glycine/D-amino acid oxidase-like deaminating enzyme